MDIVAEMEVDSERGNCPQEKRTNDSLANLEKPELRAKTQTLIITRPAALHPGFVF